MRLPWYWYLLFSPIRFAFKFLFFIERFSAFANSLKNIVNILIKSLCNANTYSRSAAVARELREWHERLCFAFLNFIYNFWNLFYSWMHLHKDTALRSGERQPSCQPVLSWSDKYVIVGILKNKWKLLLLILCIRFATKNFILKSYFSWENE